MTYPTKADIATAIDNLIAVTDENSGHLKARQLRRKVLEVASLVEQVDPTAFAKLGADGAWGQNLGGFNKPV